MVNFEEEKELIKLKEEAKKRLILLEFEKRKECIRLETANKMRIEDYKSQLIEMARSNYNPGFKKGQDRGNKNGK